MSDDSSPGDTQTEHMFHVKKNSERALHQNVPAPSTHPKGVSLHHNHKGRCVFRSAKPHNGLDQQMNDSAFWDPRSAQLSDLADELRLERTGFCHVHQTTKDKLMGPPMDHLQHDKGHMTKKETWAIQVAQMRQNVYKCQSHSQWNELLHSVSEDALRINEPVHMRAHTHACTHKHMHALCLSLTLSYLK